MVAYPIVAVVILETAVLINAVTSDACSASDAGARHYPLVTPERLRQFILGDSGADNEYDSGTE